LGLLGLNAQALRFLDFLVPKTIKIKLEGLLITLPHPAYFSLQKLIISQRRDDSGKKDKDSVTAITILNALIDKGEVESIRQAFDSMPKGWRNKVLRSLKAVGQTKLIELLENK